MKAATTRCTHHRRDRQRGGLLISALMLSAAMGIGLVGYLQLTKNSLKLANRTFYSVDAGNLAEAGLEEALYSFSQLGAGAAAEAAWAGWAHHGPHATRVLTFNRHQAALGTVKVYVRGFDASFTRPYIISQATITPLDGGPPITRTYRVDLQAYRTLGAAIVGLNGVTWSGDSMADSFISNPDGGTAGPWMPYPGADIHSDEDAEQEADDQTESSGPHARANAHVIVPAGAVSLGTAGLIHGNLSLGATVTPPPASQVTGAIATNYTGTWSLPALPPWTSLRSSRLYFGNLPATLPVEGHAAAADGCYYYVFLGGNVGAMTITAGKKVIILGIGVGINPGLVVQAGAYCILYVDGPINCASEGAITNNSWAGALQIFTWTTNTCRLGNSGDTMACILAPFAPVTLAGGATTGSFTGAIVAKTVTASRHMDFHYDESLSTLTSIGSIGSIGSPGTTAAARLVGITRTKWSELRTAGELAQRGALTGNFLP